VRQNPAGAKLDPIRQLSMSAWRKQRGQNILHRELVSRGRFEGAVARTGIGKMAREGRQGKGESDE